MCVFCLYENYNSVFIKNTFHYIFVTKHCWSFCDLQHHKRNELVRGLT